MPRAILAETAIHPAIRDRVATSNADIIREVESAVTGNAVVVVGMRQSPHPKRARNALDAAGIAHFYLEYGRYFGGWRRPALEMWTGWPTFPMVFVNGFLIGGANEIEALIAGGELSRLLTKQANNRA